MEKGKKKSMYNLKLTSAQVDKLGSVLQARGWPTREVQWQACFLSSLRIGFLRPKLVVQGKGTEDFVTNILEPEVTGEFLLGYEEVNHPEWFEPHAGLDEDGKGDYLVGCICLCDCGW